ncbi:MAG: RNA polymerase sigma factor [Acidobacteriota bacterium]
MLEKVWLRNQAIFRTLVRNILFDHSIIDDVLQEAFVRLLRSRKNLLTEQDAYNYARKTVVNTSIDFYRHLSRQKSAAGHYSASQTDEDPLSLMIQEEQDSFNNSVLEEIKEALLQLPPEQRQAIDLIFNHDRRRKIKDLCKEAGIPYTTVRSRMRAGIDGIRQTLKGKGLYEVFERSIQNEM